MSGHGAEIRLLGAEEADFLIDAIRFVADYGRFFLPCYSFDVRTGDWSYKEEYADSRSGATFGLDEALALEAGRQAPGTSRRPALRRAPAPPVDTTT